MAEVASRELPKAPGGKGAVIQAQIALIAVDPAAFPGFEAAQTLISALEPDGPLLIAHLARADVSTPQQIRLAGFQDFALRDAPLSHLLRVINAQRLA